MIESLRTTQIAFFRFATLCGFFRGSADEVQKVPCKGSRKRKSYETICENMGSWYQTLVSSLPREAVFRRRRPKAHFMTGRTGSPVNIVATNCFQSLKYLFLYSSFGLSWLQFFFFKVRLICNTDLNWSFKKLERIKLKQTEFYVHWI